MDHSSDEDILLNFSMKLTERMKSAGFSFRELSAASGVSVGHLSDLALGKKEPGLIVLVRIAEGLGISASDLLQGIK